MVVSKSEGSNICRTGKEYEISKKPDRNLYIKQLNSADPEMPMMSRYASKDKRISTQTSTSSPFRAWDGTVKLDWDRVVEKFQTLDCKFSIFIS